MIMKLTVKFQQWENFPGKEYKELNFNKILSGIIE